ncbi:MAG: transporter substrate-binding domain-containing protein [Bacteriovoracaceae bacterium]|nr:transporter substrate-binding domain-containing protein [Bacteriovoracaceae bacterium]
MKYIRHLVLIVVAIQISLFIPNLFANDTIGKIIKRGTLKVGLEAGYMPFEMRNKKGKIVGFDIELAKMMAKGLGVKLEIVNTEWDGIIPALLTGKFDVILSGMTLTQTRNTKVNFSDPYLVVGQSIILNKKLKGKIKSYKDLNNKKYKVASKLGTTGEEAVKRLIHKATYKAYQTEQEGVMEVVNGRIDAFVYDYPYNAIYANGKGKGKVHFLSDTFTYEPIAIAVRKKDPDIINWLNNFLRQIKRDGRYDKIYAKWFQKTDWLSGVQ